jgi:hypothetical protein
MGFIYHADKITRKATLDVSLKVEGMSVKAQLIINTFQWHAAGVGLLKNVVDPGRNGRATGIAGILPGEIKILVQGYYGLR